jgi:hypothetical protein
MTNFFRQKVYLIAATPQLIKNAAPTLTRLGGKQLRPFAWVFPWTGNIGEFYTHLEKTHSELCKESVITELNGGDFSG